MLSLLEVRELIEKEELAADKEVLHLTANEAVLSHFARNVLSSSLGNRYLLENPEMRGGSPSRLGQFLYRGLSYVSEIEQSATEICRNMFGANQVEFRCLSGMHALQTTIASTTLPGEKIMRLATKDGGHFLTERVCKLLGRESCTFAFDHQSYRIDLEGTQRNFERERPKLLYLDPMNYLFPLPLRGLREIAGSVPIVFDVSHTLGLIAGHQFQNPFLEGADIIQGNTHKTFWGPQKAIILGNNRELMDRITYNLSNGLVSSQHTASTLALFIALHEAFYYGREYASRVVHTARFLAETMYELGVPILAAKLGFTQNHMFYIDVRSLGPGPSILEHLLAANISANRAMPFENTDTIRIGVQEIVRRGYGDDDLKLIAQLVSRLIISREDPLVIRDEVVDLVRAHKNILFSSDDVLGQTAATDNTPQTTIRNFGSKDGQDWISTDLGFNQTGGPLGNLHRWVDCYSVAGDCEIDQLVFAQAREIGRLAGEFRDQTDSAGNLSVRVGSQIFVSASGCYIRDLKSQDFVELLDYGGHVLRCRGNRTPSSEALMHYLIYQRTDCAVVVHTHYLARENEIRQLDIAVVPPIEPGSIALAVAAAEACSGARIVYLQRHGMVFWGPTLEDCRMLIQRFATLVMKGD